MRFGWGALLPRLLLAYLVPSVISLALLGLVAHRLAERALDESLGRRLTAIAQAATTLVRPDVVAFLSPGDDDSRSARRLRDRLQTLRNRTGVARIFVIDKTLRGRSDTDAAVRIGDHYYNAEADRTELDTVFGGTAASSVLFAGKDGRLYKTGYAPLHSDDGHVTAAIGVQGSAELFEALAQLRHYLWIAGILVATFVTLVTVIVSRRIARPLKQLAQEATRIGSGDLTRPIAATVAGEVGLLASTMNVMRRDLAARDEQMQMMLSGIAHEVRNPLAGIALFAGLLRDELADKPRLLEMVNRIDRELGYLQRVVNEFLDYARHRALELQRIDLGDLVRDVGELMQAEAEHTQVALHTQLSTVYIDADREQLRRVLLNVIRNALQACSAGGQVHVCCKRLGTKAMIEIRDDGCGMTADVRDKVLQPFFTTRDKGTGLGLPLSNKILQEHNAELSIESKAGVGTTVRIELDAREWRPAGPD